MRKYRNQPVTIDGQRFDSQAEARRWAQLKLLERGGEITSLTRQQKLELAPSVRIPGENRARPAVRYIADFAYLDCRTHTWVWEDVKGVQTAVFRLKQHLAKSVHNIDVRVVK
jgi:IS5 family transposase